MKHYVPRQLDDDFNALVVGTFSHRLENTWSQLRFEPAHTVAWPATSQIKALCHALIDQLPAVALNELVRTIEELEEYYSRPIAVTPASHMRKVNVRQGRKHAPPVLDLTEF